MAAGQSLSVGGSQGNDIRIEHPGVSQKHAELRVNEDGSFDVFDLGAAAGTFVFHNGKWTRFAHATVAGDERLRLGTYETSAGALYALAADGAGGQGSQEANSTEPSENVHEVTTRRGGGRRRPSSEDNSATQEPGRHEQSTRRRSRGTGEKTARVANTKSQTVKLPADHARSEKKSGPTPRVARAAATTQAPPPAAREGSAPRPPEKVAPQKVAPEPLAGRKTPPGKPKSLVVAYLLWFFLGVFGAHRFYLGSLGIGITLAVLLVLGVVPVAVFAGALFKDVLASTFTLLGVAVLTCLVVWWIVDAFLIPGLIADRREQPGA